MVDEANHSSSCRDRRYRAVIFRWAICVAGVVAMPSVAVADCVYNGKPYAEGTRIGVLLCEEGHWVLRP